MSHRTLPESTYEFRRDLLTRLDRFTVPSEFWYVNADTCVMRCPLCAGSLRVAFAGTAPRAELVCERCPEHEIVDLLRGGVRA